MRSSHKTQISDEVGGTLLMDGEGLEPSGRELRSEEDGVEEVYPASLDPVFGCERTR